MKPDIRQDLLHVQRLETAHFLAGFRHLVHAGDIAAGTFRDITARRGVLVRGREPRVGGVVTRHAGVGGPEDRDHEGPVPERNVPAPGQLLGRGDMQGARIAGNEDMGEIH